MALNFDGTNFLIVDSSWPVPDSGTGIISFSFWVKFDTVPSVTLNQMRIIGSDDDLEVRLNTSDTMNNDLFGAGTASTTTFVADTWYHIVATGDANTDTNELYVDGVLDVSNSAQIEVDVGTVLHLGTRNGASATERLQGTLDDVRSYNRVLSAEEVATIYAVRGHDGIVDGLTGRWLMNELALGDTVPTGSVSIGTSASSTGTSVSLDIGTAGTDRLVVVIAGDESDTVNLTGVTVDGNACTNIAIANNIDGLGNHQEMWAIDETGLGSSSGTVTVAITGGDTGWAVAAQVFTNVASATANDSGINETVTTGPDIDVTGIDANSGGVVVAGYGQGTGGLTATYTSPLVERESIDPAGGADLFLASAVESGGASAKTYTATMSATFNRGTGIVASWDAAALAGTVIDASDLGNDAAASAGNPTYAESELSFRKRAFMR